VTRNDDAVNFIWQTADLLRGRFRAADYAGMILPMTLLRCLDDMLAPTKAEVRRQYERARKLRLSGNELDQILTQVTDLGFYNVSLFDIRSIIIDSANSDKALLEYIDGFSANIRSIFERYEFKPTIQHMRDAGILHIVLDRFSDPHLELNHWIFEELVSKFTVLDGEGRGEYFTPRDVVKLTTSLLFTPDRDKIAGAAKPLILLDPACGTGGNLAESRDYVLSIHPFGTIYAYGQEINQHTYAISASIEILRDPGKSFDDGNVRLGDSLIDDKFSGQRFDYFLCNPPFGLEWKLQKPAIENELHQSNNGGRFEAGLPRVSDSSFLFLQHMWSKRKNLKKGGSRLAITFTGSPMFVGGAGSGESQIRRWLFENDWLEAIIALPESLLYNTAIGTYVWLLSNRKEPRRAGKVQLIDARAMGTPGSGSGSRRSVGDKRLHVSAAQVDEIVRLYDSFREDSQSKILDNIEFGYARACIEYPLRLSFQMTPEGKHRFLNAHPSRLDDIQVIDDALGRTPILDWTAVRRQIGELLADRGSRWGARELRTFESVFTETNPQARPTLDDKTGSRLPDPQLREFEKVPLREHPSDFFRREIAPYKPEAWLDHSKTITGYEINFDQHFQIFTLPRPIVQIEADLRRKEEEISRLLGKVIP
jgi:type I restriction enzyme M protein